MIVEPKISELLKKVDSRYTLVSVVAKRARKITEGDKKMVDSKNNSVVSVAAEELVEDKYSYEKI